MLLNNVDAFDVAKLQAFLRFGADRLKHRWEMIERGAAEVCLIGAADAQTLPGEFEPPRILLRILQVGAPADPDALTRPLQYESVMEALSRIEAGIAAPAPVPIPVTSSLSISQGDVFRLRRWPRAALLAGHAHHLRLASFLSARHIGLDDLARLSNVDRARCAEFLQGLAAADLLSIQPAPVETVPTLPACVAPTAERGTLFSRIRRSLGMAWAR